MELAGVLKGRRGRRPKRLSWAPSMHLSASRLLCVSGIKILGFIFTCNVGCVGCNRSNEREPESGQFIHGSTGLWTIHSMTKSHPGVENFNCAAIGNVSANILFPKSYDIGCCVFCLFLTPVWGLRCVFLLFPCCVPRMPADNRVTLSNIRCISSAPVGLGIVAGAGVSDTAPMGWGE